MVYRVCSISGGGVRGIIPATIIKEMLKIAKAQGKEGKITDLCDYIIGTSIGGIIGAGLVVSENKSEPKFTSDEILNLLQNSAAAIFPEDANYYQQIILSSTFTGIATASTAVIALKFLGLGMMSTVGATGFIAASAFAATYKYANILDGFFAPKYSRDGIDKLLDENFGELRLSDTIIPFTTVSFSLEKDNPRVWSTFKAEKTLKDNLLIKDALGATSAAPTFFPHKVTNITMEGGREEIYYDVDGGIFANSPVSLGLAVLKNYASVNVISRIEKEGITVLSIGTGYHKGTEPFTPPTSFQESICGYIFTGSLIEKVMQAAERDSIVQARYVYKALRLDPKLEQSLMPMDKSNPVHIKSLSHAVDDYVVEHSKIIEGYVKCMLKDDLCDELITESTPNYSYELIF
jgi:patatin-like phospholipase/acyl hydrolase